MEIHKYVKKKDFSGQYIYQRWNYTTACCFKYKTKCVLCPNNIVCEGFKKEGQMHPMKYATMMTYRNIGTKGLNNFKFIDEERKEENYDEHDNFEEFTDSI